MAKIDKDIIQAIIRKLGGATNILQFGNCMTRLRVSLGDRELADLASLKGLSGVLGIIQSEEQIQVVVGAGKAAKGREIMEELLGRNADIFCATPPDAANLAQTARTQKAVLQEQHTSPIQQFFVKFATIFTPLIPGFIAAGLLLGIGTLIEQVIDSPSPFILSLIGYTKIFSKSLFTFMSILIGYNANRAFGGNGVNGGILGAFFILSYDPSAENKIYSGISDFFGLTIDPRGNIIGVLIAAILAGYLEKKVRKFVADDLDMILTSTITLLLMGVVTFIAIMPLGIILYQGMTWLFLHLSGNPIGSAVLAGLFLISVMLGIHQGFVPVYFGLVETQRFNSLFPILAMAGAGQVGAALALFAKAEKHSFTRQQILGAIIPGFLGIGEPLIYGVTLPRVTPFITACCGGAVGGFFIGFLAYLGLPIGLNSVFGPSGLVAIPLMTSENGVLPAILIYFSGLVISYVAGFFITLLLGLKNVDLR